MNVFCLTALFRVIEYVKRPITETYTFALFFNPHFYDPLTDSFAMTQTDRSHLKNTFLIPFLIFQTHQYFCCSNCWCENWRALVFFCTIGCVCVLRNCCCLFGSQNKELESVASFRSWKWIPVVVYRWAPLPISLFFYFTFPHIFSYISILNVLKNGCSAHVSLLSCSSVVKALL